MSSLVSVEDLEEPMTLIPTPRRGASLSEREVDAMMKDVPFTDKEVAMSMLRKYRPDIIVDEDFDEEDDIPTLFDDPFCFADFKPEMLKRSLPRLGFALLFYWTGLYCNNLSQAWLQQNMTGFYESAWGYSMNSQTAMYEELDLIEPDVYEARWGNEEPDERKHKTSAAMKRNYFNKTVTLYDVGFLFFPEVDALEYAKQADMFAGGSAAFGLLRFVIFPGPMSLRWTYLSRVILLWGLLFFFRGITIILTPLPNPYHQCVPKITYKDNIWAEALTNTPGINFLFGLVMGRGLEGYNEMTCQDVMFSGHTAMGTIWSIFSLNYLRKSPWFPDRALSNDNWFNTARIGELIVVAWLFRGWYVIVASHFHYSVDVAVGIFLTLIVFRSYHARIDVAFLQTWIPQLHPSGGAWYEMFLDWFEDGAKDMDHERFLQMTAYQKNFEALYSGPKEFSDPDESS